jgi:hypothetical protein
LRSVHRHSNLQILDQKNDEQKFAHLLRAALLDLSWVYLGCLVPSLWGPANYIYVGDLNNNRILRVALRYDQERLYLCRHFPTAMQMVWWIALATVPSLVMPTRRILTMTPLVMLVILMMTMTVWRMQMTIALRNTILIRPIMMAMVGAMSAIFSLLVGHQDARHVRIVAPRS